MISSGISWIVEFLVPHSNNDIDAIRRQHECVRSHFPEQDQFMPPHTILSEKGLWLATNFANKIAIGAGLTVATDRPCTTDTDPLLMPVHP